MTRLFPAIAVSLLVVPMLLTSASADSFDITSASAWGIKGSVAWGEFYALTPSVSVQSYGALGSHPFIATLPTGFTSGSMIWELTVNGSTYIQSVSSYAPGGFNSAFPGVGCSDYLTSGGMVSGVCGSAVFKVPVFKGSLPAHLTILFTSPSGLVLGQLDRDFRMATTPEPGTWLLLFTGLAALSLYKYAHKQRLN